MIIINADDWGRTKAETDAALTCYKNKRITSVTAMVFMEDSERAAELAKHGGLEVGLHLNLTQPFSGTTQIDPLIKEYHGRIVHFLTSSKFAFIIYNPSLTQAFQHDFQAQYDEFVRLYGEPPTHIDGHHHQHLCTNMIVGGVIPAGQKVRRSFYFWPEEKSFANRAYRQFIALLLKRKYQTTDYFFALSKSLYGERLGRILALAKTSNVEIMTHPANSKEFDCLMTEKFATSLKVLINGSYLDL